MTAKVTSEDEGKDVIDANGERIGTVREVDEGRPFVEPAPGINATVVRALGWAGESETHPLRVQSIDAVTESAIRLRSNL